ncbi:MAG: tetratricopeptide repeat protein [Chromatiales bacterium]|nr:tetratricopeptide repeat protein [Chromatiales bacterium]
MEVYRVWLVLVLCLCMQSISAQMYKWVDENGNVHFSDRPPPSENSSASQSSQSAEVKDTTKEEVRSSQVQQGERISDSFQYPPSILLQTRELLLERKFSLLNQRLAEYDHETSVDVTKEEILITAYRAFDNSDISLSAVLDDWVIATPDDYQPYLARSIYYQARGWSARGGKWASETEKEQFETMNAYFKKASDDLSVVYEKNRRSLVSYYSLIRMMKASSGNNKEVLKVLKSAIKVNPGTYYVRHMAMLSLVPRWGGSYKLMRTVSEEAKQHSDINPRLNHLEGIIYTDAGEVKRADKKYNEANALFDKALEFGEEARVLHARSHNNYRKKNYREALRDINRAIELNHEWGAYYHRRSRILGNMGNYRQALRDIDRALALEPDNKRYVESREWVSKKLKRIGYEQYKQHDPESSIETFTVAIRANPDDASLYYRRGRSLIEQNKFEAAIEDIKKAIELNPDDYEYYLLLDWLLAKQRDWDQIISYWDQYIARNPDYSRAYVERGGAYFHKGDMKTALEDAKRAADMGNVEGKEAYDRIKGRVQ